MIRILPAGALLFAACTGHADDAGTPMLREVSVSARRDADGERLLAVNQKTVLDRKEIEALGGLTVDEVIRKLPGIEAAPRSGDGGPNANARGMGRDAVQFLVDGERPSANARYALTAVGRLPSGELERVEILRGTSAEHGGGAPVTVNLIMKKARPTASTAFKAAAGLRGDEPNGQFSLSRGGSDRGFSWIVPLSINHHGMPQEKLGRRQQSVVGTPALAQNEREESPYRLDEFVLSPRLSWRGDDGNLSLWPSLYHNRGERRSEIDLSTDADPAAGGRHEREESRLTIARLRAEAERKTGLGKLSGRVALMGADREQNTARQWIAGDGTRTHGFETIERDERELSSSLRLDRPAGDGLVSAGVEQAWHRRDESQRAAGSSVYAGAYAALARQWTAWLQHEWPLAPALTLTYGLRGERVELEGDGRQSAAGQLAPSLAGRYELGPDLILRSSLGAGLKAPKLEEISGLTVRGAGFNSPLEADRGGNPGLRAERNLNAELALDRHLPNGAGTLGINLYLRRTEDFIERRTLLEGDRWVERPYNEGNARHWGVELDAKLKGDAFGWSGASLRSHLTLPKARVEDARLGITRDARDLPRYQWSLGVDQALPGWQASAGFQINLYGPTRTEIPGETSRRQQARTLIDLHAVRRLSRQLNLRLEVQNLIATDTSRLARAWSGSDDWTLATRERGQRTLLLSLEGQW
ncbi:MAG: TonB-dependent receptor [Dechloromonas sp.]|nr:TonB-dependent receptor [Dechloromonas sp.]